MYKFIAEKIVQKKIDILMDRKEEERRRYRQAQNRPPQQVVQVRYVPQPIPPQPVVVYKPAPPVLTGQPNPKIQVKLEQKLTESSNQPIQKFDTIIAPVSQNYISIQSNQIFPITNLLINIASITLFIYANSYNNTFNGLSITGNVAYGTAFFIGFFYGLRMSTQHYYPCMEKCGLIFTYVWPRLKYYALKQRTNFEVFYLNIHCMLIVDIIITFFYMILMVVYIILAAQGDLQSKLAIANYIFVILVTVSRISMMIQVYFPFTKAAKQLGQI